MEQFKTWVETNLPTWSIDDRCNGLNISPVDNIISCIEVENLTASIKTYGLHYYVSAGLKQGIYFHIY